MRGSATRKGAKRMKKKPYIVAYGNKIEELETEVEKLMQEGYKPQGGVTLGVVTSEQRDMCDDDNYHEFIWAQAMVLSE